MLRYVLHFLVEHIFFSQFTKYFLTYRRPLFAYNGAHKRCCRPARVLIILLLWGETMEVRLVHDYEDTLDNFFWFHEVTGLSLVAWGLGSRLGLITMLCSFARSLVGERPHSSRKKLSRRRLKKGRTYCC